MKDETDLCLAYRIGASKGYTDFDIYGGVGGREAHTFANYCLLLEAKNDKNDVALIGNGVKTFVVKNEKKQIFGAAINLCQNRIYQGCFLLRCADARTL